LSLRLQPSAAPRTGLRGMGPIATGSDAAERLGWVRSSCTRRGWWMAELVVVGLADDPHRVGSAVLCLCLRAGFLDLASRRGRRLVPASLRRGVAARSGGGAVRRSSRRSGPVPAKCPGGQPRGTSCAAFVGFATGGHPVLLDLP
jgi:hypothetical protein